MLSLRLAVYIGYNLQGNNSFATGLKQLIYYTICNSFDITLELSKLIKEKQTNPPVIILGGPHASELPAEILTNFHYI